MNIKISSNSGFYLVVVFLLFGFALWIKMPYVSELADLLWAEDGNIFISQAYTLGVKSILIPYAGYLHVYPRILALFVPLFGLQSAPLILFFGWLSAVIFSGFILIRSLNESGIGRYIALTFAILIFLQPSSGEVYFNITNAQWFLGFALGTYFILNDKPHHDYFDALVLPILLLTGPFCIFLLPVVLVKYFLFDDFRKWSWRLAFLVICSLVQFLVLISSERSADGGLSFAFKSWLDAVYIFVTFGGGEKAFPIAIIFWGAFLTQIYAVDFHHDKWAKKSILLICYGLAVYVASLLSIRPVPNICSPVGGCSRYFWIPYATLFAAFAILSRGNKLLQFAATYIFGIICLIYVNFPRIERSASDFSAYVEYALIKRNVVIRLNPISENSNDVWKIDGNIVGGVKSDFVSKKIVFNSDGILISDQIDVLFVVFKKPDFCSKYSFVGVSVDVEREKPGQSQIFWSKDQFHGFGDKNSRTRYYVAGRVEVDFVFPNSNDSSFIKFVSTRDNTPHHIHDINIYCFG